MSSTDSPDPRNNAVYYLVKLIARQSAIYGAFDFLGRATAMILVPLYAKKLNTGQFGSMEILTVSQSLLVGILVLGLNSALVRFYTTAKDPQERIRYLRTAFTAVTAASVSVVIVLMLFANDISRSTLGSVSYTTLWRLVFLTVIFDALLQIFLALYRSQERPVQYSLVNLGRFLSTLGLNVLLVGFFDLGVSGAIVGNLIGTGLGFAIGLWFSRDAIRLEVHKESLARLCAFGFSILVHPLAMFVVNNSDRFILKAYVGVSAVGVYALGYKIGLVLSLVVNAFLISWQPLVYKVGQEEGASVVFSRILTYFLFVGLTIVVAISSFSHEIVALISGPEYAGAAAFIWLILLSYLLQGVYYIFSTGIMVGDRMHWFSVIVVIGAVVNLLLNFLLIPRLGMQGAAWSTVISFLALSGMMFVVSQRHLHVKYETWRITQLLLVEGAVLLFNTIVVKHGSASRIGLKLLALLILPLLLGLVKFFTAEELLRARLFVGRLIRNGRSPG
jgi:O-antigen/teichoic acid export membrane protein